MAVICERFDHLGFDDPHVIRRLGIMGGTFDPIHIGHLACAEQARVAHDLDAVVFIPTGRQPDKRNRQVTVGEARLEMCKLACASNPFFDVSSIEIDRAGETYTADTLRQLHAHYPDNVQLFFITGADAVLSIVKWHESAVVADLAQFIAVTRPGYDMTDEAKAELAGSGFQVSYLETTALSVSSSMLRAWVAEGKSIRYLTSLAVHDYIASKGLYKA